jgi:hypothetical protein
MDSEKAATVPTPNNGASADVFCFLSSLPLLPPATEAVFGSHLSSLFSEHCIPGAGLPSHMMGEVAWDPKRRRPWTSYIQSSLVPRGREGVGSLFAPAAAAEASCRKAKMLQFLEG